ncbi:MAG: YhcB family protein [Gammaproteobacteria bacterium]|nr:YhcB family protein [Gammaproteobacteria bacterium]
MATAIMFLLFGLVVGGLIGYFLKKEDGGYKSRNEDLAKELERTQFELGKYKADVANHFLTTANLINNMTDSYRAVHEHLAEGANSLCAEQLGVERLEIRQTHLLDKQEKSSTPTEVHIEAPESENLETNPESVVAKENPVENVKTVH